MKIVILIVLLYVGATSCQDSPSSTTTTITVDTVDTGPAAAPSTDPLKITKGACNFVYSGARYYQVEAQATLLGSNGDIFVNDALIRLLRSQLNIAPCQLDLSEGAPCFTNSLHQPLPCADPVFDCGNELIISKDVFSAVASGDCNATSPTLKTAVCETIANNPNITTAVNSGACVPLCIQDAMGKQSASTNTCLSYDITLNAPTEEVAQALAANLTSTDLEYSVIAGLETGFEASSGSDAPAPAPAATPSALQFLVASIDIRTAVGYGYFPPPPPPLKPLSPANTTDLVTTNVTAAALASSGVVAYGPWSACTPACGDGGGFSTRTVSCFSPDGTLMPLQACPGGSDAQTYQSCSNQCYKNQPYWTYTAWSPCSATCGGGNATRQAICQSPDTPDGQSPCKPEEQQATSISCNTAPCKSFSWKVSPWGECSAPCGKGNRTREVKCVGSNNQQVDSTLCTSRTPPAIEVCNIQPCDFCTNNPCLGRGTCSNSTCTCRDGYSGTYCEVAASCKSGIVDANLACCVSGLVNVRGECCPQGDRLDADGECCSQSIDVCGVCGGTGLFIDMQGTCCTVADANGVCCRSGNVDECGVCNGLGNTCDVKLTTKIQVPASLMMGSSVQEGPLKEYFQGLAASMGLQNGTVSVGSVSSSPAGNGRRKLLTAGSGGRALSQLLVAEAPSPSSSTQQQQPDAVSFIPLDVNVIITPPTDPNTTHVPFNAAYLAAQMEATAASSEMTTNTAITMQGSPEPGRDAICGNGVCEIGERSNIGAHDGSCPQDCGLPAIACLGGCGIGGNCLPASGVCQCYVGYLRPNCDDCAQGFVKSGGVCVSSVTSLGLLNSSVLTPAGEATVSGDPEGETSSNSSLSVGAIVGITIASVVGVAVVALLLWCCCRRRRSADEAREALPHKTKDEYMFSNPAYAMTDINVFATGPREEVAEDEELGLRHKYGATGPSVGPGGHNSARLFGAEYGSNGGDTNTNTRYSAGKLRDEEAGFEELGLRQKYGATGPSVGPGGPNSARLFVEQLHSARSNASSLGGSTRRRMENDRGGAGTGTSARGSGGLTAAASGGHSLYQQHQVQQQQHHEAYQSQSARNETYSNHLRQSNSSFVTSSSAGWHSAREEGGTLNDNSLTSADLYKSKLFFNPAFSLDQSVNQSVDERRAKLQALRDAVKALESRGTSADDEKKKEFLPGRPSVPRLALGNAGQQEGGAFVIKAVRNPPGYGQVMGAVDDALMEGKE